MSDGYLDAVAGSGAKASVTTYRRPHAFNASRPEHCLACWTEAMRRRAVVSLVESWRERARFRRGDGRPIDSEGRLILAITADLYEACATELEAALHMLEAKR